MAEEPQDIVQAFLEECIAEHEQVEKQLKEVEMMVRQSSSEVEKFSRRSAEITNRIRQMEANFDTVPRPDIKNLYTAQIKEQGRLHVITGQVERLQADQESLKKRSELLARVIEVIENAAPRGSAPSAASEAQFSPEQHMIVRIIEAQENERQHLSREMHDGPAQRLTNVILQAEICRRLLDTDPSRARVELDNLKDEVNKTFLLTRSFIADLRPMMLDDLGLVPTLKRHVSSWQEKTGIKADFTVAGKEHRLAPYSEVTIFRAIQQFMKNAEQHANPSHVQVSLQLDGQIARATVEDDGVGFDIDEVMAAADGRKTVGIASVMDQVQMLGGSLHFDSVRGRGTKVTLEVPEN
jgi:two-component system sensor histidine kinase DegS